MQGEDGGWDFDLALVAKLSGFFKGVKGLGKAVDTIEKYNGKIIVVVTKGGGKSEVLEGNWDPTHLVILEFESMGQARKWYKSSEYTEVAEIRKKTSTANFVLVETL